MKFNKRHLFGLTFFLFSEAATIGVLCKKVFLEISQNSEENTCARVSFLIKLKRDSGTKKFSSYRNRYRIQLHDAELEQSLEREKLHVHMVLLLFYMFFFHFIHSTSITNYNRLVECSRQTVTVTSKKRN